MQVPRWNVPSTLVRCGFSTMMLIYHSFGEGEPAPIIFLARIEMPTWNGNDVIVLELEELLASLE